MRDADAFGHAESAFDMTQSLSLDSLSAIMAWTHVEHIRLILLSPSRTHVLLTRASAPASVAWDLPHFQYGASDSHLPSLSCACRDLQAWLSLPPASASVSASVSASATSPDPLFTALFELLPPAARPRTDALAPHIDTRDRLVVLEAHADIPLTLALPPHTEWKSAAFVSALVADLPASRPPPHGRRRCLVALAALLRAAVPWPFRDPRHRFGWHAEASAFLRRSAAADGARVIHAPVEQLQVTPSSNILRVPTDDATSSYYLKAPALASAEVSVTVKASALFPDLTPTLVAASVRDNYFVTRGFVHVKLPKAAVGTVMRELARIHLHARHYVHALRDAGCPLRDMEGAVRRVRAWMRGEGVFQGCQQEIRWIRDIGEELVGMCQQLSGEELTLCHGDFAGCNMTCEGGGKVRIFDWEFAHVGVGICDVHRIDMDASQDDVDGYLQAVGKMGQDGRQVYEVGRRVGWVVRMWALEGGGKRDVACRVLRGLWQGLRGHKAGEAGEGMGCDEEGM